MTFRRKPDAPRRDVAAEITNLIIEKLESGVLPWSRPWGLTGAGGRPLRHCGTPYAQPIARPSNFVAIHNAAERQTIVGLLDLQYRLRRRGIGIGFKRLLFDVATSIGDMRPDMLLDLRDFTTGEVMEAALEIVTAHDADTLGVKLRQVEKLRTVAPVVTIHGEDLEADGLEAAILDQLHIGQ